MLRYTLLVVLFACAPSVANAHLGHLGEVAGHGHLVAVGAIAAAGLVAGLVAKAAKRREPKTGAQDISTEENNSAEKA